MDSIRTIKPTAIHYGDNGTNDNSCAINSMCGNGDSLATIESIRHDNADISAMATMVTVAQIATMVH